MLDFVPSIRKLPNTRYCCRNLEFFPNPDISNIRQLFSAENTAENVFVVTLASPQQQAPVPREGDGADPRRGGDGRQPPLLLRRPPQADRPRARRRHQVRRGHGRARPRVQEAGRQVPNSILNKQKLSLILLCMRILIED